MAEEKTEEARSPHRRPLPSTTPGEATQADGPLPEDGKGGDYWLLALSALGSVVVVYLLFFPRGDFHFEGKVVGVLKTDARVRRRHERSLGWEEITRQENLYRKDIVYTPPGATAFIEFGDHRRIQLEPDSMIQLDDVSREQIQITLFSGKVKGDVKIQPKTAFRWVPYPKLRNRPMERLPDPQALELLASEWEQRVNALLGRRGPRERMRTVTNPEIHLDSLEDYDVQLVYPAAARYNLRANRWLSMRWSKLPVKGDVNYELDVSKDAVFSNYLTYRTKQNSLSVQFDDPGTYYWRVRVSRDKEMKISQAGHFVMAARGGIGNALATRLPAAAPQGYTAEISRSPAFQPLVSTRVVSDPHCDPAGLPAGNYYCRVSAIDGSTKPRVYPFEAK